MNVLAYGIELSDFKKDCLPIPSSLGMNNISRHLFMHEKNLLRLHTRLQMLRHLPLVVKTSEGTR